MQRSWIRWKLVLEKKYGKSRRTTAREATTSHDMSKGEAPRHKRDKRNRFKPRDKCQHHPGARCVLALGREGKTRRIWEQAIHAKKEEDANERTETTRRRCRRLKLCDYNKDPNRRYSLRGGG